MTDPNQTPIEVNPDQTMTQLGVALRYALTAVGSYLVGKGWIDGDALQAITSAALVIVPALYAFYRAHQQKKALVRIAQAAPDSVAVVKP